MTDTDFDSRPIGVFDSGVGGLTVLNQVESAFPQESFIYLGDTARLPYGSKSSETIKKYVQQNLNFFLKKNRDIKALVIACNSASSVLHDIKMPYQVPAFGVINPGAKAALAASKTGRIGLWATRATVNEKAYERALKANDPLNQHQCYSCACPLLVPLVEEGLWDHPITYKTFDIYLPGVLKHDIDTLILGCTHYPLLKSSLMTHLQSLGTELKVIDSAIALSAEIQAAFKAGQVRPSSKREQSTLICLTDESQHFKSIAFKAFPQWKLTDFEWVNI